MGLLDIGNDPLMGLATGLLSASGPSRTPVSFGQALGAGVQGMNEAQHNGMMSKMRQAQIGDMDRKRTALTQLREQLPEQMRPMFDINPEGFLAQLQKESKRHVVGNALVDDSGSVLYQGQGKDAAPTGLAKLIAERDLLPTNHPARKMYDAAINKETTFAPPMVVQNYPSPVPVIGPDGKPALAQFGNKGDVKLSQFAPAPDAKPPTEAEGKAAFFASNMKAATKVLDRLEAEGMNMSSVGTQAATALSGGAGNLVTSPRAQQARQAQNQWAEQMLRMQTGAAATADEISRTVSTYFPQIGDSQEVVNQKREMRKQAEGGVYAASGRAQDRVPSDSPSGHDLSAAAAAELKRRGLK